MSRTGLSQNTTWYIDPNGDDSHAGDAMNPWKTAQYGFEKVQRDFDGNGYTWGLQLNDGDHYVPSGLTTFCSLNGPMVGAGGNGLTFNVIGNQSTIGNCRINLGAGQYGFSLGNHIVSSIYGVKFVPPITGGVGAIPLFSSNYGSADIGNMEFAANPFNVNMYCVSLGTLLVLGTQNKILGNVVHHYAAEEGGRIKVACDTAIPSAISTSDFVSVSYGGYVALTHATYSGAGIAGCTGRRGYAQLTSFIRTDGNGSAAPGNVAFAHDSTSGVG